MASASSKRSLDTDYITFRRVFAKLSDNSQVPANYVLASYGDGRTYWAQPSTLGALPTFNEVFIDSNQYRGSTPSGTLRFSGQNGILLSTLLSSTTSSLQLIDSGFLYIDISGANSLYAYSNFTVNNTIDVATTGFLSSTTTPSQNLLTIRSFYEAPALSTNIISFQNLKVVSSLTSNINTSSASGIVFTKQNSSSFITLAGIQDFQFQTNFNPAVIALNLSSYSANGFLGISSVAGNSYISTMSTISSIYTQKDIYSTALTSLSTVEYTLYSTNRSTIYELSNYTQLRYDQKFGDTMARATIIQLVDQFGILNVGMSTISSVKTPVYIMTSTNKGFIDQYSSAVTLSTSTFADFGAGSIFNFTVNGMYVVSTQLSTFSTAIGTSIFNTSNAIQTALSNYTVSTTSTFANLATIGYISSLSLQSTLKELGTTGYVSTASLISTVSGLQNLYPLQNQFLSSLQSTTAGLFARQNIISTLTLTSSLQSTTRGIETETANTYVSSAALNLFIPSTQSGYVAYAGSRGFISTASLTSTLISSFAFGISSLYTLRETLLSTLTSTTNSVMSINSLTFVSVPSMIGYASTLSNQGYIYRNQLQSTVDYFYNIEKYFTSSLAIPETFSKKQVPMINAYMGSNAYIYTEMNQYFSSVQYQSLGGYSKKFDTGSFVTIEYTPNIFFSALINASNYNSNHVSTFIQIGDTYYLDTMFRERKYMTSLGSNAGNPSNVYSRKIIMQMNKDDFLQAETKGFAISHIFTNIVLGGGYTISTQCALYTPRSNALFISIYN